MNWLERARREIRGSARSTTADTAERTPMAVTAVPHLAISKNSRVPVGYDGGTSFPHMHGNEDAQVRFSERVAVIEYDSDLRGDDVENAGSFPTINRYRVH